MSTMNLNLNCLTSHLQVIFKIRARIHWYALAILISHEEESRKLTKSKLLYYYYRAPVQSLSSTLGIPHAPATRAFRKPSQQRSHPSAIKHQIPPRDHPNATKNATPECPFLYPRNFILSKIILVDAVQAHSRIDPLGETDHEGQDLRLLLASGGGDNRNAL